MTETHQLVDEIARLNAIERRIADQFIHRSRVAPDSTEAPLSFGDRVADRVTAFGGSWTFISFTVVAITVWMLINASMAKPFDAYAFRRSTRAAGDPLWAALDRSWGEEHAACRVLIRPRRQ